MFLLAGNQSPVYLYFVCKVHYIYEETSFESRVTVLRNIALPGFLMIAGYFGLLVSTQYVVRSARQVHMEVLVKGKAKQRLREILYLVQEWQESPLQRIFLLCNVHNLRSNLYGTSTEIHLCPTAC